MAAYLMVRAEVPAEDREKFDHWYENEHLPDAKKALGAVSAFRGWCDGETGVHLAVYQFSDIGQVQKAVKSQSLTELVKEFDRVWEGRIHRTREVFEAKQVI